MRKHTRIRTVFSALLICLLFSACSEPEVQTDYSQKQVEERCIQLFDKYQEEKQEGSPIVFEDRTICVLINERPYPPYLQDPEPLLSFWSTVQEGDTGKLEIVSFPMKGMMTYRLFQKTEQSCILHTVRCGEKEDGSVYVENYEVHDIQDMTLTSNGNFYYRILPAGDKHYPDYSLIRAYRVDPILYEMAEKYIVPVGYTGNNMFLTDWSEKTLGELCVNDLFEVLSNMSARSNVDVSRYPFHSTNHCYLIPAEIFEETVLGFLNLDVKTLRKYADYDPVSESYPYRPIQTNDFVKLWYFSIDPVVTAKRENPDGTITLCVEVLSRDVKCDCVFAHEVTIRPLSNGDFQYVSNQVVYISEYGLPYNQSRMQLGPPA